MIICTCYSSWNLTHSKAHLHTLGTPLPFTHHVCLPLEKADFTFQFTAASSADVWPAKLQYQQWSFGSHCFGRKKAVRSSSLERLCHFWAANICLHFLHVQNMQSSPWGLNHDQVWAALRQVSRGFQGHLHLGCQGKDSCMSPTDVALPSCPLRWTLSSLV